ncbi:type 3 metallothionein [Genlisea aurea]|uniref:Type 3 metallothionein n=1 Tax=Genlisea aurea TaxID=192259 RepID=S8CQS9_9LAMI|nr:type 3 metallothionein [Genlisea aurea]
MSGVCGNCDCADKTQCVKNGNVAEMFEIEKIVFVDVPAGAENDCKCGSNCTCAGCKCGK